MSGHSPWKDIKCKAHEKMILPEDKAMVAMVDSNEYAHPPAALVHSHEYDMRQLEAFSGPRKAEPPQAPCHGDFHARKVSGRRPLSVIDIHVLHCTQSDAGTARGVAKYFETPNAGGSAHYCLDDYTCYRTLDDSQIPWGAPGANYRGLHYEQCGWVSWGKFVWSRSHRRTINRTAWKIARDAHRYGNPVKWLDVHALRRGDKGITDHATCTKAFGGSHTDPGPNYPRGLLMSMVRFYYYRMKLNKGL